MAWVEKEHNDHLVSNPLLCAASHPPGPKVLLCMEDLSRRSSPSLYKYLGLPQPKHRKWHVLDRGGWQHSQAAARHSKPHTSLPSGDRCLCMVPPCLMTPHVAQHSHLPTAGSCPLCIHSQPEASGRAKACKKQLRTERTEPRCLLDLPASPDTFRTLPLAHRLLHFSKT